jgi:hypothetical protein
MTINNPNGDRPPLLPQHAELLQQSGISEEVQKSRAYRSVENADELTVFGRGQRRVPALLIPMYDLDGDVVLHQLRPDHPRTLNGKPANYEIPKGKHYVIDVPPLVRGRVGDQQQRLFVVVGIRRADALVSRDQCAIALLRPNGWKDHDDFWNRVPLDGRQVVIVLDSNTAGDKAATVAAKGLTAFLTSRKAIVKLIVLPSKHTGTKVGVDDYLAAGNTVDDLLALPPTNITVQTAGSVATYCTMPDGLYRNSAGKVGPGQRLTNFLARIVNELVVTDGETETREFELEAVVAGETKLITITAPEFESTTWPLKHLGAEAILTAGYGVRDHVRAAIQQVSPKIGKIMVYTHIGWVHHNGQPVFLHAGGAIGADGEICGAARDQDGDAAADVAHGDDDPPPGADTTGCEVAGEGVAGGMEAAYGDDQRDDRGDATQGRHRLNSLVDKDLQASGTIGTIKKQHNRPFGIRVRIPSVLQGYRLPPPPTGDALIAAVRASMDLLKTAPDQITIPVYAAGWRAILGEINFALQLVGRTQVGKTVIAALAQQHFGAEMDAENLPAAWFSTGNSIIATAFLAKDVLLTVDDLVPTGSAGEADQAHKKAELVLRAQGNRAGRARCRGDGSLIEGKAPRGLILSTGEDTPDGPSLNSRTLVLPVNAADVDWGWVTACQEHAKKGLFAMAMAGFLQWMAKDYDAIVRTTRDQVRDLHRVFSHDPSTPSRTATILANLLAGLENFLNFATECGAIEEDQFRKLWERAHDALMAAAQVHVSDQESSDPVQRFRDLLAAAFHSGRAYVANVLSEPPAHFPEAWGWGKEAVVVPAHYGPDGTLESMAEEQARKIGELAEAAYDGDKKKELFKYRSRGQQVGWCDDQNGQLYLIPSAALAVVQRLAQADGRPLPITERTLGKA